MAGWAAKISGTLTSLWHTCYQVLSLHQHCVQITIPQDLLTDIDALVGQQGRNNFLVEVLRKEINRRRLLQLLSSPEPFWKDEDHPELREGAEVWVHRMRDENLRLE